MTEKESTEKKIRNIHRQTRKKYSAEEKISIVLEGLRGDETVAELCRREGISSGIVVVQRISRSWKTTLSR